MQKYYEISTDKGIMRGFFHQPELEKYPVCIVFHGFTGCNTGTKFSYVQLARRLEKQGIGTIRMDFLGSGESDLSFRDMTFEDELSCAKLILNTVRQLPSTTQIYVLGHSMGGVIASELAKAYPQDIQKLCLWAPAFHLPQAVDYLIGQSQEAQFYDHNGFEISHEFVKDITSRDFYQDLDIYQNDLLILHGTKDMTVPFDISKQYLKGFKKAKFIPIVGASHNYDQLNHIQKVIQLSYEFLIK